ncbi:MAG: hypothetical protein U0228_01535 [Myxococcaceae bacterium]
MLAALHIVVHATLALAVEVGPGVPCELATSLPRAIADQKLPPLDGSLKLQARSDAGQLTVRLVDGDRVWGERTLKPSAIDCAVLPKTIGLLVRSWTAQRLGAQRPAPAPEPVAPPPVVVSSPKLPERRAVTRKTPRAAPTPTTPEPTLPVETPPVVAVTEPPAPAEPVAAPAVVSAPPAEQPRDVAPSPPAVVSEPKADARVGWSKVALAVHGGAAWAPSDQLVGTGLLLVHWQPTAFGVVIEAAAQSERLGLVAPGTVSASVQWLGLLAAWTFQVLEHSTLIAAAGLHLTRLSARSEGYVRNATAELLSTGALASAEWRQRLFSGVFASARVEAQLRIRPESFSVAGVGEVLRVPSLGFLAGLGLGWSFD